VFLQILYDWSGRASIHERVRFAYLPVYAVCHLL
jgi:hypothetical protein